MSHAVMMSNTGLRSSMVGGRMVNPGGSVFIFLSCFVVDGD
jgi:hypothetical protein